MKIRNMTKKDIPKVIDVLAAAFNDSAFKRKGVQRERKRTINSISPYLEIEPEGAFIACSGSKILGALFAHSWGKFGWIGTFGVHPEHQGKGIGKKLIERGLNYLDQRAAVTTLALETMTNSMTNLGLYSRFGFRPAFLTVKLIREISGDNGNTTGVEGKTDTIQKKFNVEVGRFSQEENKEDILTRCSWLADKILNGLDYQKEIMLTDRHALGETILIKREGFVIGYAICRTTPRYEDDTHKNRLEIKVLVLDKGIREKAIFDFLLTSCEHYGRELNKQTLTLSVNTSYWVVYRYLLDKEFRVHSAILRMIKFSEDIISHDRSHEWLVNCSSLTM